MLPALLAFLSGFVNNAAVLQVARVDPRLGVRSTATCSVTHATTVTLYSAASEWRSSLPSKGTIRDRPLTVSGDGGTSVTVRLKQNNVMKKKRLWLRRKCTRTTISCGRSWKEVVDETSSSRAGSPLCEQIGALLGEPEDIVHILYSTTYGGFGLSDQANAELLRRGLTEAEVSSLNSMSSGICEIGPRTGLRTHPIALALFDEMGSEWCSGWACRMTKGAVPARWADFVLVDDDDGKESLRVNFDEAFRYGIEKILDDDGSSIDDARAWRAVTLSGKEAWPDLADVNWASVDAPALMTLSILAHGRTP